MKERTKFNLLHFLAGIILSFLLLEAYYQVAEIALPYHALHGTTGKRMMPSKRINYFGDGFYIGQVNKYGYLGPAYAPQKPDSVKRVALIGDSYTEGLHLFEKYHFRTLLENDLNKESENWQVLNFGVGNYNFNDMIVLYNKYITRFSCDYLVFVVSEDDFYFRKNFIPSPVLTKKKDTLIIDTSFVNAPEFKLYNTFAPLFENSAVLKSMSNAYKISRREVIKEILFDKLYKENTTAAEEYSHNLIKGTLDDRILLALDWLKGKNVIFLFKRDIPEYIAIELHRRGFSTASPQSLFNENLRRNDISPNFWEVTHLTGHWNHYAQPLVAESIFNALQEYE